MIIFLFFFFFFNFILHWHMKTPCGKHNSSTNNNTSQRFAPYLFKKECLYSYGQACSILKAIELNGRKKLSKKCIGKINKCLFYLMKDLPSLFLFVKITKLIWLCLCLMLGKTNHVQRRFEKSIT
jgi:hypothetical protein